MPVSDDFAENGILTRTIPGFHPREAQRQMAKSIIDIIDKQGVLIAEAGTGTGKTYAYLVPALRSGKKPLFQQVLKPYKINFIIEIYQRSLKPLITMATQHY